MDNKTPLQAQKALVFGDSMIAGVDLGLGWETHVECRPGATSEQLADDGTFGLAFLLAEDRYDAVILSAGTNDPWHRTLTDTFVSRLCAQVPQPAQLVVVTPRHFAAKASAPIHTIVNLADFDGTLFACDGLHLNAQGTLALSARIRNTLEIARI
ncbi:SGNH hydrolase-type esterase [Pandoravirus salinus]|uniref:SGNH hydrolase-type esterase n=1 Tax=Pandoravirus salinus TaxID=1349410 RepID=S4VYF7_9VIRU|nr:SGNH hydrolase-type esterase domain [Pandoravirus salinus]AGO85734.1 SGNH hydrolase-type esterase [Pandoravirus salinus]